MHPHRARLATASMSEAVARRSTFFWVSTAVITFAAVAFVVFVLPSVLFMLLTLSSPSVVTETQRSESPDRLLDSVVMQTQPGFSIEPYFGRVYVAPASSHRLGDPILEIENAKNLKTVWLAPKLLEVSYTDGCIATFHSHWPSMKVQNGLQNVEVRLKPPDDLTPRRCD